ncbi:hypothetical protein TWF281_001101 [Arthrobotrys megalospora]
MATLSIIPTELLLSVSKNLSLNDLRNLCLVSKSVYQKAETIFLEKAFRRRKYYATMADSKILLEFSKHPRGLNAYLKHLVIDLFVPYYEVTVSPEEIRSLPVQKQVANTKVVKMCHQEVGNYWSYLLQDQWQIYYDALFAAIPNFPNLEIIDFVQTGASDMSLQSLKIHFPKFVFEPDILPIFKDRFLNSDKRDGGHSSLQKIYVGVMRSLAEKPLRKLREINICFNGSLTIYSLDPRSFEEYLKDLPKYNEALKSLRKVEIRTQSPTYPGHMNSQPNSMHAAQHVTRFLSEIVPQLDTLIYKCLDIRPVRPGTKGDLEHKKYKRWFPSLWLPELHLPNIRVLHLEYQSFLESELSEFLIAHKRTLREITLKQCLLQTESQQWSPIFQLLESDLSLTSFFFDGLKQYNHHKCIPWFRVRGKVQSDSYLCEVVPGATENLDFRTAMNLIRGAEPRLEAARVGAGTDEWLEVYLPWRINIGEEQIEPLDGNMDHKVFVYKAKFRNLQAYIADLYAFEAFQNI